MRDQHTTLRKYRKRALPQLGPDKFQWLAAAKWSGVEPDEPADSGGITVTIGVAMENLCKE